MICLLTWLSKTLDRQEGDDCGNFPIFRDLRRYEREVEQAGNRGCDNGIVSEIERPDCQAQLIYTGPGFAALSEHLLPGFG